MTSRDRLRHPGPEVPERISVARGDLRRLSIVLPAGAVLLDAVAEAMDAAGADAGVICLDGVEIGPYRYVMPGPSDDGSHAAWYSETFEGRAGLVNHGTAIVGRRDGAWWLHAHAVWNAEGRTICGHLLPDGVTLARKAAVTLLAFDGGGLMVAQDPETLFPIFHARGGRAGGDALIARIAPHEDIHGALCSIIEDAGFARAEILGIGSLIGATFTDAGPMASPISEVLILPGAGWDRALHLPMHCVDPDDGQFRGSVAPGGGAVCVTFEVMVIRAG
ncbi:hypothetical protein [Roseisalinus antarcticus]|uniref:PPC domain-containing protein n=1 Tax=Roseisalinus antarcticus TaxID=254357 RepID=A0A1Y5S1Q7_9RHOB|nr:hypothetical protein [Roseisalinus antarcticus]SLN27696.1 hypothetical protein ROA7023_00900 [Roseisalinus antarcticus]